jgi:peptidoglycan/LPS O-acetylase OafA/YrhL
MYHSLQACRAFAAIMVLLYHAGGIVASGAYFGEPGFAVPFAFGGAGVEFFFVLSGFIICHAHRRDIGQPQRLGNYLRKRAARIYPTYWIVFVAVLALALALPQTRASVSHDVLTLAKAALLVPLDKTVVGGTGAPVLGVAWTLQYEMMFYAFFALLVVHRGLAAVLVLAFAAAWALAGPAATLAFPGAFVLRNYTWLFLLGMGVAMACARWRLPLPVARRAAVMGALAFAAIAAFNIADPQLLESHKILLYGIASAWLVFGLVQAENQGETRMTHPLLQLLGNASYALYLIHYPLISLLSKILVAVGLPAWGLAGAFAGFVLLVGAALAAAVAFHLLIERPLAARLSRKPAARPPVPAPAV